MNTIPNTNNTIGAAIDSINENFTELGAHYPLDSKKAVFIGDSITYQRQWIPQLVNLLGITYVNAEINPGVGGYYPTGVGGSKVVPIYSNPAIFGADGDWVNADGKQNSSLFTRAKDIKNYNPDIIFVFGGQNDSPTSNIGTISDPIYLGGEVPVGDPSAPTFISAYKGMLYQLSIDNPAAKIVCITIMHNWYYDPADGLAADVDRLDIYNAIVACAKEFSCTLIDLWNNGPNVFNAGGHDNSLGDAEEVYFIADGAEADWITNGTPRVHPNSFGGDRIALEIASVL